MRAIFLVARSGGYKVDTVKHDPRDVGGTPGGFVHFVLGVVLAGAGAYLFFDRVHVYGGYWSFGGSVETSFGVTLIPVMVGVAMLFANGKSTLGWLLFGGGLLAIATGIIANLRVHFASTSLFQTLIMLGMVAGGVGLVIRALYPVGGERGREVE